ncbi:hypothetical protein WJX79_007408 [Trebouxia sp. C0005]
MVRHVSSCVASPAKALTPKLSKDDLENKLQALPAWQLNEATTTLTRTFTAKNFVAAVKFFDQVAEVAEEEDHHPDLHLTDYREVKVVLSTHAIGGLSMLKQALDNPQSLARQAFSTRGLGPDQHSTRFCWQKWPVVGGGFFVQGL